VRVLLDACVPRRLARAFGPGHAVATVTGQGWSGTTNSALGRLAAAAGVAALVTVDARLHVAPDAPLSVLVLRAGSHRLAAFLPLLPSVLAHLSQLQPGRTEIIATRPPA
jgi:hypothetical protein